MYSVGTIGLGPEGHKQGSKVRKYLETDLHIVGFTVFLVCVDNEQNIEYCQPHPLTLTYQSMERTGVTCA